MTRYPASKLIGFIAEAAGLPPAGGALTAEIREAVAAMLVAPAGPDEGPSEEEEPGPYAAELEALAEMGFADTEVATTLLAAHDGNVGLVVPLLLEIEASSA